MVDDAGEFGAKPREFAGVELAFKDRVLEMIAPGAHDAEDEAEAFVVADVVANEVGGAHGLGKIGGFDGDYAGEAPEVGAVQGEQIRDAVYAHVRGQARVVNLNTAYFVGRDESLPFLEDLKRLGKNSEKPLNLANLQGNLGNRETEARPLDKETFQYSAMTCGVA